jgi:hypothetical protein
MVASIITSYICSNPYLAFFLLFVSTLTYGIFILKRSSLVVNYPAVGKDFNFQLRAYEKQMVKLA